MSLRSPTATCSNPIRPSRWFSFNYTATTEIYTLSLHAALPISTAVGALNGAVVALLGIQPFVVTLASMIGIRGLAKWMTGNANIDIGFGQDVAAAFADLFRRKAVVIG